MSSDGTLLGCVSSQRLPTPICSGYISSSKKLRAWFRARVALRTWLRIETGRLIALPPTRMMAVPRYGVAIDSPLARRRMEITRAGGAKRRVGMDPGAANIRPARRNWPIDLKLRGDVIGGTDEVGKSDTVEFEPTYTIKVDQLQPDTR